MTKPCQASEQELETLGDMIGNLRQHTQAVWKRGSGLLAYNVDYPEPGSLHIFKEDGSFQCRFTWPDLTREMMLPAASIPELRERLLTRFGALVQAMALAARPANAALH